MVCFLFVLLSDIYGDIINGGETGGNFIWVANGLLLSYLLLAPRWRWPAYVCAGFTAHMSASLLTHGPWVLMDLAYAALDIFETLIGALLLRWRSTQLPHFADLRYLIRFIGYAVVAGPAAIGLIYTVISVVWLHGTPVKSFLSWAAVDGLGTFVVTPAFVAIFQSRFSSAAKLGKNWFYLSALVVVTIAAFTQNVVPLVGLIYPFLVAVLIGMGLGWAALATLFVAAIGSWFSLRGIGPASSLTSRAIVQMQVLVASAMLMLYAVSIVLERLRTSDQGLRKLVAQHLLVTENSRDVIIISGLDGHCSYVSRAAERMFGWKPEDLLMLEDVALVHPEDRAKAKEALRKLGSDTEESTVEYRIQKRSGDYSWVEASLRVIRDPETGARTGILNMIRDISERKEAQRQLQNAFRAVEALAVLDALTGLANRRRFDQCLTVEWRRCLRECKPLSILLIDADLFKSYNDSYGHLRGDSCLRQIAESALDVVTRPGDLVARFGGEEFAVIMPNTSNQGAMLVANKVCNALRNRNLTHEASPFGIVTISVGCATVIPQPEQIALDLVQAADKALYEAKDRGRNCVCNGNARTGDGNEATVIASYDDEGGEIA